MSEEMPGFDEQDNEQENEQDDVVRQQSFSVDGSVELDVAIGAGRLRVELTDEPGVHVEVRHDETAESPWAQGLSGIMNWFGQQFGRGKFDPSQFGGWDFGGRDFSGRDFGGRRGSGRGFGGFGPGGFGPGGFGPGGFGPGGFGPGFAPRGFGPGGLDDDEQPGEEADEERPPRQPREPHEGPWGYGWPGMAPGEAVRQTRIEQSGKRVIVHAVAGGPMRLAALAITVRAPAGSHLSVRAATADVLSTGRAGRVWVHSGTGDVAVEQADGPVRVRAGAGALRLGRTSGGLTARSGSGDIELDSIGEPSTVAASSGSVRIGVVTADLTVRTGSGDVSVSEAVRGRLELVTGSGDVRVGVRTGVGAAIDLSSRTGDVRSELPISDSPPEDSEPRLSVRGRTGSGDALVTSALATSDAA